MVPVPISRRSAGVAQLVEHLICNEVVGGSSPFASSAPAGRPGGAPVAPGSSRAAKESGADVEGCPSGQREQTVNLPAYAFEGSNPSPSTTCPAGRPLVSGLRARCQKIAEGRP